MSQHVKKIVNGTLRAAGYELRRVHKGTDPTEEMAFNKEKFVMAVSDLHGAMSELLLPELPPRTGREDLLARLIGTPVPEAMYILAHLHRTTTVPGEVCEFGAAQGATSALLANEILDSEKHLWLYDSFQGLPAPTEKDKLIDDIFGLGSMDKYTGTMVSPRDWVEAKLKAISFPQDRTHIIAGFFGPESPLPDKVSFAYIDFDFYEPILMVLRALWPRMSPGSVVVVDDYGFFSSGAQAAVDEFVAEIGDEIEFSLPKRFAAVSTTFCILKRR